MIKKIKITESQFRKLVEMEHLADLGTDYPLDENKKEIKERCWKGYTQKGMKTMFGKRYPNCVKKTK
jgi:hypothetical protein